MPLVHPILWVSGVVALLGHVDQWGETLGNSRNGMGSDWASLLAGAPLDGRGAFGDKCGVSRRPTGLDGVYVPVNGSLWHLGSLICHLQGYKG